MGQKFRGRKRCTYDPNVNRMSDWRKELDIREYEAAHFISRLIEENLGSKGKVLNIGASWGRDSKHLAEKGFDVTNVDIAPAPELKNCVKADAEKQWPFRDNEFGAVVMAEILEHLYRDLHALKEVHRVLRPCGVLVATVPFHNDDPEFHVRSYTPKTIKRLLDEAGFTVVKEVERGGIITFGNFFTNVLHPDSEIGEKIDDDALESVYGMVLSADWEMGVKGDEVLERSNYWGSYFAAEPKS